MRVGRTVVRLIGTAAVAVLLAAGCGDDGTGDDGTGEGGPPAGAPVGDELADVGGVDPTLTRPDVDCTEIGLGEDAEIDFTTARYVVDGTLGAVCFGDNDPVLADAWRILADIVPPGQLADLGVFGGFATEGDEDAITVAFVEVLDDDSLFQMAVNLAETEQFPDEATLTMVHEFSHVFTALPGELDRDVFPEDCTTYDNGEGCYVAGSIMDAWAAEFWDDGLLDQVDPNVEATFDEAQERCDVEPGFFGAYAATNPEEDFAEAFSAYVLRVPPETDGQAARYAFMDARPGLVEFRDRAEAAGYGPQENTFDPCGEFA